MGRKRCTTINASLRTNNHIEGWHSRLKEIVGKSHPNILIVDVMKKEQACTEMKMEQFESGDREYWVENSVRDLYKKQRNKTNYFAKNCKINPFFRPKRCKLKKSSGLPYAPLTTQPTQFQPFSMARSLQLLIRRKLNS